MMFEFATNETERIHTPQSLLHQAFKTVNKSEKDGTLSYLRPDGGR